MKPFEQVVGTAAPFLATNIDTDQLLPKQFMRTIVRKGLARALFYNARYLEDGGVDENFILNREPFNTSSMLITGPNFGCGSSREHAVWALDDFGIRCLIGSSFGEIFAANCGHNGLLTISLDARDVERLGAEAKDGGTFEVDLRAQTIVSPSKAIVSFAVDELLKERLLAGRDQIDDTLLFEDAIARFENNFRQRQGQAQ